MYKRQAPPLEQLEAIWSKSVEEQAKGWLSPFLSEWELDDHFGEGLWRALMRFALWQHDKWRLIDDASVGHNDTYGSSETIHTTSAAAAAALTKRLRDKVGAPLKGPWRIIAWSRDMKSAYKQLCIHPDQIRYCVIAFFDPHRGVWVFAISYALAFGLAGAVLHFNRIPALIVAFCRRWMAIPVQNFYDDLESLNPLP